MDMNENDTTSSYYISEWDKAEYATDEGLTEKPTEEQPSMEELYSVAQTEEEIQAVQAYESGDIDYIPMEEPKSINKGLLAAGGLAALYFLLNK